MPDPSPAGMTVAVCTHDRAALLPRCVDAIARQLEDVAGSELVVVDSGSRDGTADVVAELGRRWPGLRYVRLDEPGLSAARNRALVEAANDAVAFVDDDAEASAGWLTALARNFVDGSVDGVAGRSTLAWDTGRPSWLGDRQLSRYSAFDLGPVPRPLAPGETAYGVNMAVRRAPAREVGGFPTALGRRGGGLYSNEEDVLFNRLRAAGRRAVYEPGAVVVHHVPAERARLWWLARRSWAQGRSNRITDQLLRDVPGRPAPMSARSAVTGLWRESRGRPLSASTVVDAAMLAGELLGAALPPLGHAGRARRPVEVDRR